MTRLIAVLLGLLPSLALACEGGEFIQFGSTEVWPGVHGMVQLYNPPTSPCDVQIRRLSVSASTGTGGFVINRFDRRLDNWMGGNNKRLDALNANQPEASVYTHFSSVLVGTGVTEYFMKPGFSGDMLTPLTPPLILPPGVGIYVGTDPGVGLSAHFEWSEVPAEVQ